MGLATLPLRRSFVHESPWPFAGILGGEYVPGQPVLDPVTLLQGLPRAGDHDLLGLGQSDRRAKGNRSGHFGRPGEDFVVLDDFGDKPPALGERSINGLTAKDDLHRRRIRDLAGQDAPANRPQG